MAVNMMCIVNRFMVVLIGIMTMSLAAESQAQGTFAFTPSTLNAGQTVRDPIHMVIWSLGGDYNLKSLDFEIALKPNGSNAVLNCQYDGKVVPNCSYDFDDDKLIWSATSTIFTQLNMNYSGVYSLRWEAVVVANKDNETKIESGVSAPISYERQALADLVEIDLPQENLTVRVAEVSGDAYQIPLTLNAKTNSPALNGKLIIDSQGIDCKLINKEDGSVHECTGMVLPAVTNDKPAHFDILLENINQSAISSNTPLKPVITAKVAVANGRQAEASAKLFLKESLWSAIFLVAAGVFVTYILRLLVLTVKPNLVFAKMVLDAAVWLDDAVRRMTANGPLDAEQQNLLSFVRNVFDAWTRSQINKPKGSDQGSVVTGLAENTMNWLRRYSAAVAKNASTVELIKARDDFMNRMVDKASVDSFKTETDKASNAVMVATSSSRTSTASFETDRTKVVWSLAFISLARYLVFFMIAGLSGYSLLWAGADTWGGTESYIKTFLWGMGISLSGTGVISFASIEDQLNLKTS